MGKKILEIVISFLILILSVAAIFFIYKHLDIKNKNSYYTLMAEFESVDGLKKGSPIKINGIKIGNVIDMTLNQKKYSVNVIFSVNNDIYIPKDSNAAILTEGFIGQKFIAISPGIDSEMLNNNACIFNTTPPVDVQKLIQQYILKPSINENNNQSKSKDSTQNNNDFLDQRDKIDDNDIDNNENSPM